MKKLLLASAIAALSISAQAAPTVYGKAFLTLDYEKDGRTQLNSNGSRIGIKGAESVTENTNVVYQLEYGVDVDADKGNNFRSRDTYIGLSNKTAGTVIAGRLTGIDDYVNYADQIDGGAATGDGIIASYDGNRANNAIAYISPKYNGVHFKGMYVMDENNSTDTLGRDAYGVSAQYEPEGAPFRGGVSYIQAGSTKITRLSGAVDMGTNVTVGALYQNLNPGNGGTKENSYSVSGTLKTATPWTAYAQYDKADNLGNVKDVDAQRIAVGGKYEFSQAVTGHIYGASRKDSVGSADTKTHSVGGGIEYKF